MAQDLFKNSNTKMTEIGKYNTLNLVRETANGVYLDGEDLGEILMPAKFVSDEIKECHGFCVHRFGRSSGCHH